MEPGHTRCRGGLHNDPPRWEMADRRGPGGPARHLRAHRQSDRVQLGGLGAHLHLLARPRRDAAPHARPIRGARRPLRLVRRAVAADRPAGATHPLTVPHPWRGSSAERRVPPAGGLSRRRAPPSASTRSASPRRPEPCAGSAPPTPSSTISTSTARSSPVTRTTTREADAYLAAFASASEQTK